MPHARIFQRPKSSTQSGRANTDRWLIEFEPSEAKKADPLTGWAGSGDVSDQVRLTFPDSDAAVAYAEKQGWTYTLFPAPERTLKLQAYADNFR